MTTARRRGNNEGTAPRLRPDGRWQIDLRYQDTNGALKRTAVYGKTQAETRAKAKELRKRLEHGQPVRDTTDTLDSFAGEWITTALAASERKASHQSHVCSITRSQIMSSALGRLPLSKITPRAVEGWLVELNSKGLAESTVRIGYDILLAILSTAVRDGALRPQSRRGCEAAQGHPEGGRLPELRPGARSALSGSEHPLRAAFRATGQHRSEAR